MLILKHGHDIPRYETACWEAVFVVYHDPASLLDIPDSSKFISQYLE